MKRIIIPLLSVAFLLAACGISPMNQINSDLSGVGGGPAYPEEMPLPMATAMAYDQARAVDGSTANMEAAARERMVVRNAELSVVVAKPEEAMSAIAKLAEELGGFVVSSNIYQSYTPGGKIVPEASIAIRVPSEKLDEALAQIKADAVEVQNETVSGQDVTSAYVDLESQLKNLEAAEKQLSEIMSRAETTEDVLNVYNQLTSIRGQIESIKGQMKYYEESVALSAISVRLVAEETVQPIEIGGWHPDGWARDALQDLVYFWQDFTKFLIGFALNFLPKLLTIGIVFGLPLWLIVRAVRRKRKARSQAQEEKK